MGKNVEQTASIDAIKTFKSQCANLLIQIYDLWQITFNYLFILIFFCFQRKKIQFFYDVWMGNLKDFGHGLEQFVSFN